MPDRGLNRLSGACCAAVSAAGSMFSIPLGNGYSARTMSGCGTTQTFRAPPRCVSLALRLGHSHQESQLAAAPDGNTSESLIGELVADEGD